MIRRVNFLCMQKTKWVGDKAKVIEFWIITFGIQIEIEIVMG